MECMFYEQEPNNWLQPLIFALELLMFLLFMKKYEFQASGVDFSKAPLNYKRVVGYHDISAVDKMLFWTLQLLNGYQLLALMTYNFHSFLFWENYKFYHMTTTIWMSAFNMLVSMGLFRYVTILVGPFFFIRFPCSMFTLLILVILYTSYWFVSNLVGVLMVVFPTFVVMSLIFSRIPASFVNLVETDGKTIPENVRLSGLLGLTADAIGKTHHELLSAMANSSQDYLVWSGGITFKKVPVGFPQILKSVLLCGLCWCISVPWALSWDNALSCDYYTTASRYSEMLDEGVSGVNAMNLSLAFFKSLIFLVVGCVRVSSYVEAIKGSTGLVAEGDSKWALI
jgi:hypothetical protein